MTYWDAKRPTRLASQLLTRLISLTHPQKPNLVQNKTLTNS